MSYTIACPKCKGAGFIIALVSMHDDAKERCECTNCFGTGKIHPMTDEEERDYHADYW